MKDQSMSDTKTQNTNPITRRAAAWLLAGFLACAGLTGSRAGAATVTNASVDLAILIIAADGNDTVLPAIRKSLDFLGTPYVVYTATQSPGGLTSDLLFAGTRAFYSGVILTSGNLAYTPDYGITWASALSPDEWITLQNYQADFGIRQVTWYSYPTAELGFGPATAISTADRPLSASFTAAGKTVFSYVNTTNALQIRQAWTYLAPALDTNTAPLLVDARGNALAAVKTYPDGRQNLALTFDSNEFLTHHWVLGYGVINWVTKGLFLGERRIWLGAQVDDLFLEDEIFGAAPYRITGADLLATIAWQRAKQARSITKSLKLDMAFNGAGATGIYTNDTLTPIAKTYQSDFKWINHTYEHELLTTVDYAVAKNQITLNNTVAASLGLSAYSRKNMVTPEVSGLENPAFLQAAYDNGIRFLVTDTSQPGYNNPSPNAGITNRFQPGIFMIPRYPNNLFYNVSTPAEWMAEYNFIYNNYWGRDLTYAEILAQQSDLLLSFLIQGNMNPWMFHQSNLRAYDGTHSLLSDLLDATLAKYEALFLLPILSPTMDELGTRMARRTAYNVAGVSATRNADQTVTFRAVKAATFPVTGLKSDTSELNYGKHITTISLAAGQSQTVVLK